MKHEDFIQQLEQFAEIKIVKEPVSAGTASNRTEPVDVYRSGEIIDIDLKDNPTWNVAIKKLKAKPRACDDCGQVVKNRVVHCNIHYEPEPHFRHGCNQCRRIKDPTTGEYSIHFTGANNWFKAYFKAKKGLGE
jgi:hypothetical protein